MARKDPHRPSLRERVEARKRGVDLKPVSREEKRRKERYRFIGLILQVVGLIALMAYAVILLEQGFERINITAVILLSAVFIIGRVITLSLSFSKKR